MTIQLVFTHRFSMAHRLISGQSLKCAIPHGHNEFVSVTIQSRNEAPLDGEVNMLESFEKVKKRWHEFIDNKVDHALQLSDRDPLINYFKEQEPQKLSKIVVTKGDPTTEMMIACLMAKLQTFLNSEHQGLYCSMIKLEETPTNTVKLIGENAFEKHLGNFDPSQWWYRDDFSINNFQIAN